jgi:hypothetical protein
MSAEEKDAPSRRKLCSFPVCGAMADWFTDFFGETEYYCEKHKPMIPLSLLKRADAKGRSSQA